MQKPETGTIEETASDSTESAANTAEDTAAKTTAASPAPEAASDTSAKNETAAKTEPAANAATAATADKNKSAKKEKKPNPVIRKIRRVVILVLAGMMLVFSIANLIAPGCSEGEVMLYILNAGFLLYGIFFDWCEKVFAHGFLRAVRVVWRVVLVIFLVMILFINAEDVISDYTGEERVAIVLGAPISEYSEPSGVLQDRAFGASIYMELLPESKALLTGGGKTSQTGGMPEAEYLQAYLMFFGIPESRTMLETKSMTTAENFIYSRELLEQKGYSVDEPYVVITSSFHSYRAKKYAEQAGFTHITCIGIPPQLEDIPPWYLREVVAIINFWITGK